MSNSENKFGKINVMLNVVQSLMLPFALIPVSVVPTVHCHARLAGMSCCRSQPAASLLQQGSICCSRELTCPVQQCAGGV